MTVDSTPLCLCNEGTENPLRALASRHRGKNIHPVCRQGEAKYHAVGCHYRYSADHPRDRPAAIPAVRRENGRIYVSVKGGFEKRREYPRESGGAIAQGEGIARKRQNLVELVTLLNLLWTESKLHELGPILGCVRTYGAVRERILDVARRITSSGEALSPNLWVPSSNHGGTGDELITRLKTLPSTGVILIVGEVLAMPESLHLRPNGDYEIKFKQMLRFPIVLRKELAAEFLAARPILKRTRGNGHIWIIGKIFSSDDGNIHFDSISGFRTQSKHIPIDSDNEGLVFDKADREGRHVRKPLVIERDPDSELNVPDIEFLDCEGWGKYPGEVYQGRKDDPDYKPHVAEKEARYADNRWAWFVESEETMPDFPSRKAPQN